jgi:glutamyl-tRNA reductase
VLESALEPTLMVIGLNHRTAPVAVRESFWISEGWRVEALVQLAKAEGVEEGAVLATGNRTDASVVAQNGSTPISYSHATGSCSLLCHGHTHEPDTCRAALASYCSPSAECGEVEFESHPQVS